MSQIGLILIWSTHSNTFGPKFNTLASFFGRIAVYSNSWGNICVEFIQERFLEHEEATNFRKLHNKMP